MRRNVIVLGLALALGGAAAPSVARAQQFGFGASAGTINDVSADAHLDGFKWGEVTGWFEYRMEDQVYLRLTYGSMMTKQTASGAIVETPTGSTTVPELDERIGYGIVSVSYHFWEGFFSSGLVGGIGGYGIRPDTVLPAYASLADVHETVFGWHAGAEGDFRVTKNVGIDLRLIYHNISAHPHRQFVNADLGATWRF